MGRKAGPGFASGENLKAGKWHVRPSMAVAARPAVRLAAAPFLTTEVGKAPLVRSATSA